MRGPSQVQALMPYNQLEFRVQQVPSAADLPSWLPFTRLAHVGGIHSFSQTTMECNKKAEESVKPRVCVCVSMIRRLWLEDYCSQMSASLRSEMKPDLPGSSFERTLPTAATARLHTRPSSEEPQRIASPLNELR